MRVIRLSLCLLALVFVLDAHHHPADHGANPASNPSWIAAVEANLARAEYDISGHAPQAPNRAHDLRTYFEPRGVRVVPRVAGSASWTWQLALVDYGRETAPQVPAPATRSSHENRMEYRRGALVEWYVNDEHGLEQGFTLQSAPAGSGPLAFDLALSGTLAPQASADGSEILLVDSHGAPVIRYGSLRAQDAKGRVLASRFVTAAPGEIRIEVKADGAAYPVTVDPLAVSYSWRVEGNFANGERGIQVADAGDVNGDGYSDVIVSAANFDTSVPNNGMVLLYNGGPNGPSTTPTWSASGDSLGENFGASVATAGDVNGDGYSDVLIGATGFAHNGLDRVGAVFCYYGSSSGLGANGTPGNADWAVYGDSTGDGFGASLASAGDVNGDGCSDVIIAAPTKNVGSQHINGEVTVYLGSHHGLSTGAYQTWDGLDGNEFGFSVATAGDVNADGYSDIIVGAPYANGTAVGEGVAYVYYGPDLSNAKRTPLNWGQADALFGHSVSTAGDVDGDGYADVIVGSPGFDTTGVANGGSVQVYRGSATGVIATGVAWRAVGNQTGGELGYSVSTAGDVNGDGYADVIAGWPLYSNGQSQEGAVCGWFGSASGLGPSGIGQQDWLAESNIAGAWMGLSVGTAGDVNGDGKSDVIVGAPKYTDGQTSEGAALIFFGGALRLATTAEWQLPSGAAGAELGFAVCGGDFNGDGYSDVGIAAPDYDAGQIGQGAVWVFNGSPSGLGGNPAWALTGDQTKGLVGSSIADAGDVNGDGYDDLIVGAIGYSSSAGLGQGRAYVFQGGPLGLPGGLTATVANASWHAQTSQSSADLGFSVNAAGDVNGDGYADVIVGEPLYTNGQTSEGAAFVWLGSASGLGAGGDVSTAAWEAESNKASARFGTSVASAGDVNGDGFSDIIVGAPTYDSTFVSGGGAFVWYGSATGLGANGTPANADKWFVGTQTNEQLGESVASAGDMNGDGYDEIIIGEPNRGPSNNGWFDIYRGSSTGVSSGFLGVQGLANAHNGTQVGPAGDLNGDGFADAFSTARNYTNPESNEGAVYVIYGAFIPTTFATETNIASAQLRAAAGVGDVNGDGYSDLAVGLPFMNSNAGAAWLYYGGGGLGARNVHLRQQRAFSSTPIARLGRSDSDKEFIAMHQGWSPFGRGRLRPEYEAKPLGTSNTGTGLSLPMPGFDDMAKLDPTKDLQGDVQNLTTNTSYHWRMRFHYDLSQQPFQPFSRWFRSVADGSNTTDLKTHGTVVTGVAPTLASGIQLEGGTPNPFVRSTTLSFSLPYAMPVQLAIYDARGRLVRELLDARSEPAGWHSVSWDGADAGARREAVGAYFARLDAGGEEATRRIVLEH